ncbi:MAG: phosphodiesterase [Pseudomonadota bacterium]
MAFIQLTDLHFVPPGEELFDLSPADRLAPAIEIINRDHRDAAFLLITGDLVHRGEEEAYRLLSTHLATCHIPVRLMLGNHDSRAAFRAVFNAPADPENFVQFVAWDGGTAVICLDSLIDMPDRSDGFLCAARLNWLSQRLAELPGGCPWILALHHPPMMVGLPNMDRIGLGNGDALYEVLAPNPPKMMLLGHVHRPIHGVWRGIPFHVQRGANHQVAYQPQPGRGLMFQQEPPEFSIISITPDGPLIHTRAYLSEGSPFLKF